MLSWNLPATLPLGSLPFAIVASSPWQREHVASMLAWFVRDAGFFACRMSCVPWQSVQVAATLLPPLRALPWTVAAYSLTGCSWQVAQLTGLSFSACGIFCADTSEWHAVHSSLRLPCTDDANFPASTAIALPAAFFASAAAWHMRQVSLTPGAAAGAAAAQSPGASSERYGEYRGAHCMGSRHLCSLTCAGPRRAGDRVAERGLRSHADGRIGPCQGC